MQGSDREIVVESLDFILHPRENLLRDLKHRWLLKVSKEQALLDIREH